MDTCFIVFSHANTPEKENILNESLLSIKKTGIKVILSSHLPVSERNQDVCDYFIKDTDNLILGEDDIFNNPSDIEDTLYSTIDYIGGFRLETSVYKKNYQAGVFNLLINAFKLAKSMGFKNAIMWEYDYVLGDKSVEFINSSVNVMEKDKLESISFQSRINIFNGDIIEKEISCCYAVPVFLNVEKFLSILPEKSIKICKEYMDTSNMMIVEQWIKSNVINNCDPRLEYWYDEYSNFLLDTSVAKVDFQSENYLFRGLRSGLYFSDNLKNIIFCTNNSSKEDLTSTLEIRDLKDDQIIYEKIHKTGSFTWSYDYLPSGVRNLLFSSGVSVIEKVEELQNNKIDIFKYRINSENLEHVSKFKRYSEK